MIISIILIYIIFLLYLSSLLTYYLVCNFYSKFTLIIITSLYSSFLTGNSHDIKTHPLPDGSGYYIAGKDSSGKANIWKYLFTSSTTSQCQQLINAQQYLYGQIKLSEVTFFMLGYHPSSPYNLHIYKHTFGITSPDWSLTMAWPSGTWNMALSESLLVSSSIYSFFIYGSTPYLYMAVISLSDGSVSNRYKSSTSCYTAYGSVASGDYIIVSIHAFYSSILILNRVTNSITIKTFSSGEIDGIRLEPSTNR